VYVLGDVYIQAVPALTLHGPATQKMEREGRERLQVEMTKNVSLAEGLVPLKESGWGWGGGVGGGGGGGGCIPSTLCP